MNDKVMVSILCLTYNHERYIRNALDGFLAQKTKYSLEIIVHDDASEDNTVKIIKEYAEANPDTITAIFEEENLYSKGIDFFRLCLERYCHGKYIAFCEGDDYWDDPGKLETQISFMEKNPKCTMTFHPVKYISSGKEIGNDIKWNTIREVTTNELIYGGGFYCASPSLVFTRKVALEFPLFREMSDVGDYPLQILCALKGEVYYIPKQMGCYRKNNPGSWSAVVKQQRSSKTIKHWNTEINWLKELNVETEGKYVDAINYRIMCCNMALYEQGALTYNDIFNGLKNVKSMQSRALIKKQFLRIWLKNYFPRLYYIFKVIKSSSIDGKQSGGVHNGK